MTRNEQLEELRYAMRQTKDKRLFERYQSVLLHLEGKNNIEIASIIQRNRATVGEYIKAYKKEGITGLRMGISTGKPNRLTVEQRAKLAEIITTKIPADVGFAPYTNWTLALLISLVEREWAVTYSLRGMSKLLERMQFSHTRPTYTLANADPEKQKTFKEETFPALKKAIL